MKFRKINKVLINILLFASVFIAGNGVWDWVSGNATLRGKILSIISIILLFLMVILRIVNTDKVERVLKRSLGG